MWLLMLVALLNSGGAGYWVCHDQIRSGSFWLKVCSEDVSAPWSVKPPRQKDNNTLLDQRSCDCHFIAVDAIPSHPPHSIVAVGWDDAPLLLTWTQGELECADLIQFPDTPSPPPQYLHTYPHTLRAPPAG
ncbi:MAG: hypothetical protein CFK49_05540 [Armatimonadetes bacterium JP3_11]|nr:MAG: hypothetical protein CFK49_05540 [Armatimonadetes bacterium JP3_11]